MIIRGYRLPVATATMAVLSWSLAACGCGSGAPYTESSLTEARVTGRVTAAGKPVQKGQIIFDPANVNRPSEPARMAEIRRDGTYDVTTLIGANRVTVAIPSRSIKQGSPYFQRVCEVHTGDNSFDLVMP